MPIDPRIPLGVRVPDIGQAFSQGQQIASNMQSLRKNRQAQESQRLLGLALGGGDQGSQALEQLMKTDPMTALKAKEVMRKNKSALTQEFITEVALGSQEASTLLQRGDVDGASGILQGQIEKAQSLGIDPSGGLRTLELIKSGDIKAAQQDLQADLVEAERRGYLKPVTGSLGTSTRNFQFMTEGLTAEDKERARRIELGLDPRAVGASAKTVDIGGVPHVFDPVSRSMVPVTVGGQEVTTDTVASSQGKISATEKAAEGAIAQSQKFFERLEPIKTSIANYDEAVRLIDEGAETGVVASRLPSVRDASIALDNLQGRMGLDVIGNTTFGALSEAELKFALSTALPKNLDGPALRKWLQAKKASQQKLAAYVERATTFLGTPGNTIKDWVELQKAEQIIGSDSPAGPEQGSGVADGQTATSPQTGTQENTGAAAPKRLRFNPETGRLE